MKYKISLVTDYIYIIQGFYEGSKNIRNRKGNFKKKEIINILKDCYRNDLYNHSIIPSNEMYEIHDDYKYFKERESKNRDDDFEL